MWEKQRGVSDEDVLLREYEKIVDLFISEGRIAWELVSIYVALQVGLISGVVVLLSNKAPWFLFQTLFFLALASSIVWFFMQYRAKMWRDNWLLAGLRMERRLKARGLVFDPEFSIFEIENRVRRHKLALELSDDKGLHYNNIRYRNQRWCEKSGALRVAHDGMILLALVWGALLIVSFHYRFIV
jgi:hypothetical protein